MILTPRKTFPEWIRNLRKEMNIREDHSSIIKTGISLATLKHWEHTETLPNIKTILKMTAKLSEKTGESPQDILDTIMESIPEWRRINGK